MSQCVLGVLTCALVWQLADELKVRAVVIASVESDRANGPNGIQAAVPTLKSCHVEPALAATTNLLRVEVALCWVLGCEGIAWR